MKTNKLKTLRIAQGWSVRILAEKAQITPAMVIRYESGKVKPTHKVLVKLSKAFNLPIADFIDQTISVNEIKEFKVREADFESYLERARSLPPEDRYLLAKIIYAFTVKNGVTDAIFAKH